MGERIRASDWSRTPLGSPESWPESLKTCVRIILTSRQPMFVWWGEHLINLYNDAYKTIVGGKHPQALGQPASVVWREIWEQVGPRALSTMRDNEGTYDEALLLIMERYGYPEETYYTFSYSPVPNDSGVVGGLICANTDDTQRIMGERQIATLRELAARTGDARTAEEACELAALGLSTNPKDLPFSLVYLLDATRNELVFCASSGVIEPILPAVLDAGEGSIWPFSRALRTHQPEIVTEPVTRFTAPLPTGAWNVAPHRIAIIPIPASGPDGRTGVVIVGLNPFRLFDDVYRGFLELAAAQIAASIANAQAYEDERRRAEALAELDRAKTTFFSNISHEFRTPLTLMLGPLEDALRSPAQTLSADNLEITYRNALRLLKLVNALLDFSRIEAGRLRAFYEETDILSLTADLASNFRSAAERAGIHFSVTGTPVNAPVFVDRDMWEKIVLNLLSNALKFTFDGSISVETAERDGMVELSVTDTGVGIPEAELPRLFERFHRVEGARSRTHEGSGIGLAMVNELVKLHGGEIRVQSAPGKGSRFEVRIPTGCAHLPADRVGVGSGPASQLTTHAFTQEAMRWLTDGTGRHAAVPLDGATATAPNAASMSRARILLVDDNADMRDYVARLLSERWVVDIAVDGQDAVDKARAATPELVITDVMMPRLDGFGLLRELRKSPETERVPVIMLSARAGEESRVEGLEAGADDYLVKPFSARELVARVSTHLQIAELRRSAEQSRERLYDLFMQAPLPVAVFSTNELHHEVANPAYCEMLGRSDLVGTRLAEVLPDVSEHPLFLALEAVRRSGDPQHLNEVKIPVLRNGVMREAYFNCVAQPIHDARTGSATVMLVATDVTEQVSARRRVEILKDTAERANRAKNEFVSTLSHELRTPLNAIVGWSNLLRSGSVHPAQREKALETIERNARLQARLIDDLLDLSRIEQGKLVLSVGPVELVRVVEAAIDAVRPAAEAKGIRLQPVLDSHATIIGDSDRLQQIVWNLLSNAIKFTERGGRVQVLLHRDLSYVDITVADNGQGIDAHFLPYVFDRFRQGDASFTRRSGGLGLGLAIVRSLVELHGGTVSVHSDGASRGATFSVRLPTAPLRAEKHPSSSGASTDAAATPASSIEWPEELNGLHVLVVDDEPETRELLRYLIEQCSCRVTAAANVDEALQALAQGGFDMLVSDIGMPDRDGYSLIREVRRMSSNQRRIPAIALTAYARGEDRSHALKAGFNMHLTKPIEPSELLVVMSTLVRNYRTPRDS